MNQERSTLRIIKNSTLRDILKFLSPKELYNYSSGDWGGLRNQRIVHAMHNARANLELDLIKKINSGQRPAKEYQIMGRLAQEWAGKQILVHYLYGSDCNSLSCEINFGRAVWHVGPEHHNGAIWHDSTLHGPFEDIPLIN